MPARVQTCPYSPEPKRFGTEALTPLPPDASPALDAKGIKRVQKIVGSLLYYARAVDMTVLIALSSIAVTRKTANEPRGLGDQSRRTGWIRSRINGRVIEKTLVELML